MNPQNSGAAEVTSDIRPVTVLTNPVINHE